MEKEIKYWTLFVIFSLIVSYFFYKPFIFFVFTPFVRLLFIDWKSEILLMQEEEKKKEENFVR